MAELEKLVDEHQVLVGERKVGVPACAVMGGDHLRGRREGA